MSDPPTRKVLADAAGDADERFGAAGSRELGGAVDPCLAAVVVGVTERGRSLTREEVVVELWQGAMRAPLRLKLQSVDPRGSVFARFDPVPPGEYEAHASRIDPVTREVRATAVPKKVVVHMGQLAAVDLYLLGFIKIVPKKQSYVVVLDKDGNVPTAYPILAFDISEGPPGYEVDVQCARDAPGLLVGGPGLTNAWDIDKPVADRIAQAAFSSKMNADTIRLDAQGKATYTMPLEWWRDQARRPLKDFDEAKIHYRAVAWPSKGGAIERWSTPDGVAAPSVPIRNNLIMAWVDEAPQRRQLTRGDMSPTHKNVLLKFEVREDNTMPMYCLVQWKIGRCELWPRVTSGVPRYGTLVDYTIEHATYNPEWSIDSIADNPRYADGKTIAFADDEASAEDHPGGNMGAADTALYFSFDFDTRVHLNFEVPVKVTIARNDPGPPVIVTGTLGNAKPSILASRLWKTRILQQRSDGGVTVTNPETFVGPDQ